MFDQKFRFRPLKNFEKTTRPRPAPPQRQQKHGMGGLGRITLPPPRLHLDRSTDVFQKSQPIPFRQRSIKTFNKNSGRLASQTNVHVSRSYFRRRNYGFRQRRSQLANKWYEHKFHTF